MLSFYFFDSILWSTKVLMTSNLFIFSLVLVSYLRVLLFHPKSQRFILMFSSKSFIVFAFPFRFLIHLELIFVYDVRYVPKFILLNVAMRGPSMTCWKNNYSFLIELPCRNQLSINVWVYFWTINFISLVYMYILTSTQCYLL